MRLKLFLGWTLILIFSFIPVFLWFAFGDGAEGFSDYNSITHSLGELTGLVGMTMFALTFVLSTRISFLEDTFDGLDKVYISHGILGGTALMLILFHPILLVLKFVPSDIGRAALYLLPSSYWSVNFGIIALLGMLIIIFVTLYIKLKYHKWKFIHEFLGLMFLFAVFHIFLVRGDVAQDYIFHGYYVYATIVSLIGLGGFSYSLFLKNRFFKAAPYLVKSLTWKGRDSCELELIPEYKPLEYKSGQFIFVRFYNENLSKESHPFSIASKSNSPVIKVIIKSLGDFTSQMHHVKIGDKVSVEGPYGRFSYWRRDYADQVWIAGGIGITPFIGLAQDLKDKNMTNHITLYYSVRDDSDFIGLNELKEIERSNNNFTVVPWVTSRRGYISIKNIHDNGKMLKDKQFYLCGPASLKKSIIAGLLEVGVPKSHIHSEEFEFI